MVKPSKRLISKKQIAEQARGGKLATSLAASQPNVQQSSKDGSPMEIDGPRAPSPTRLLPAEVALEKLLAAASNEQPLGTMVKSGVSLDEPLKLPDGSWEYIYLLFQ